MGKGKTGIHFFHENGIQRDKRAKWDIEEEAREKARDWLAQFRTNMEDYINIRAGLLMSGTTVSLVSPDGNNLIDELLVNAKVILEQIKRWEKNANSWFATRSARQMQAIFSNKLAILSHKIDMIESETKFQGTIKGDLKKIVDASLNRIKFVTESKQYRVK